VDVPYIKAGFNLAGYFDTVSNAQQRYKFEVEPNMTWNTAATRVPKELWPFFQPNPFSPFPAGSQQATAVVGASNAAQYTYPLPKEVATFTAIVTVSANPNTIGSYYYRGSASYLVSLVTGYDYAAGVSDYLSIAPLFQAAAPNLSLPLNVSVSFGSTGRNVRLHTGAADAFTVRVDNGNSSIPLGNRQTFVSLEVLNLGY
jgi:hypothetical protein